MADRIKILRARAKARKDPLARATRAPAKAVTPVSCPLGQCEHAAGWHDRVQAGSDAHGSPIEGAACRRAGCDCEGAL